MSIALAKAESWEDHVEAWHALGRHVDDAAWGRAAIAASLDRRYGAGAIEKFAGEVGFAPSSVWRLAKVHKTFAEQSRRREFLTFKHHEEALAAADPNAALDLAEREGWSANALRRHLSPQNNMDANALRRNIAEGTLEPACVTEDGACGPASIDDKIFHISALIENFHAVKDYEIEPLVRVGTKKSLKDLSKQVTEVIAWLQAFNQSIKQRTK